VTNMDLARRVRKLGQDVLLFFGTLEVAWKGSLLLFPIQLPLLLHFSKVLVVALLGLEQQLSH